MVRERLRELVARMEWAIEVYRLRRMAAYFLGLVGLWVAASLTLWMSERWGGAAEASQFYRFSDCLWSSTVYLLSGLEDFEPATTVGKIAAVTVMVAGVGMLGLLGTTLLTAVVESSRLASRVKRKPTGFRLRGHVVLCGWSPKGDAIVRELHAELFDGGARRPIAIVAPRADQIRMTDRRAYRGVWAVAGDPIRREVLAQADVAHAHSVVVLASHEEDEGARGDDARTILIALAIQSLSAAVHVCTEVLDLANVAHFERTSVRELVSVRDVAARLLAHAADKHHLTDFFGQLLTVSRDTNEVYALDVPDALVGRSFAQVQRLFLDSPRCCVTPVGVRRPTVKMRDGEPIRDRFGRPIPVSLLTLNPRRRRGDQETESTVRTAFFGHGHVDDPRLTRDEPLRAGDKLVVIAMAEPDLSKLPSPPHGGAP